MTTDERRPRCPAMNRDGYDCELRHKHDGPHRSVIGQRDEQGAIPEVQWIDAAEPSSLRARLEAVERPVSQVTRFEVIDHRPDMPSAGRAFSAYQCAIELSYQDAGRTLKVFVDDRAATPPQEADNAVPS